MTTWSAPWDLACEKLGGEQVDDQRPCCGATTVVEDCLGLDRGPGGPGRDLQAMEERQLSSPYARAEGGNLLEGHVVGDPHHPDACPSYELRVRYHLWSEHVHALGNTRLGLSV